VEADTSLKKQDRRNQASAIRALGKASKQPLSVIPLQPAYLNKIFALTPSQAGFGSDRWKQIRTYCGQTLTRAGILVVAVRRRNAYSLAWDALLRQLPNHLHYRLSPLGRDCSAHGLEPGDVCQAIFDRFHKEETTRTAKGAKAYKSYRAACRAWNDAVKQFPWWPQVTVQVPDYSKRFSLPKGAFQGSFWQDFDEYAAASSKPKAKARPFSLQTKKSPRQLRNATIEHHRDVCWEMASAQVRSGRKIAEIDSLAALIDAEWVAAGPNFFLERYEGKRTRRLHDFATTMKSIATNWVYLGGDCPETLVSLCLDAVPEEAPGFSNRNEAALMQFSKPERVKALITLPYVILGPIRGKAKKEITTDDARTAAGALAIEICLVTMIRLENLANLDLDKNIWTYGTGKEAVRCLVFPSEDVKNGKELRFEPPARTWRLLDFFVDQCRPLLLNQLTSMLFPLADVPKKRKSCLRHLMTTIIRKKTGLELTPHQFRHFGVMRYRQKFPNDFETARLALGHKNQRTVQKYYAWLDDSEAWQNFSKIVLGDCESWIAELGF
jgi:integrase